MNKNKLIRSLESIIESYDKHQKQSSLPWFFNGAAGKPGLNRVARARCLLEAIREPDMSSDRAFYKIAQFYLDEFSRNAVPSRLIDKIGRMLDTVLGHRQEHKLYRSAFGALHDMREHQKNRTQLLHHWIDDFKQDQALRQLCS